MTKILVLNSGSATLKYRLLKMPESTVLASGIVDGVGASRAVLLHRDPDGESRTEEAIPDHRRGLERVLGRMREACRELSAVGHRVVHGGDRYRDPVLIDASVLETIRSLSPLAPLHNPANAEGIDAARQVWPSTPQVAVFDTAFHAAIPPVAYRYAIPGDLYRRHGVRRYGFHGISHAFVAGRAAALLARAPEALNLITLHLGNGASAAAIRGGVSVDTSMGMTPLEGLVMGTRCGDLDPAVPAYLARVGAATLDELDRLLNFRSGLLALAGTRDMREIERRADRGDADAALAIEMFSYRVKKYIGAYAAVLGRLDALVFTGGIGENSARIRSACVDGLSILGIAMDEARNRSESAAERELQRSGGAVRILLIPTDEEREIAAQTIRCLEGRV